MVSIRADNITVDYEVYGAASFTLKREVVRRVTGGRIFAQDAKRTRVRALDGVSLALADGDRLGIIGGNGAGKSTLIKTLAGCVDLSAGRVHAQGKITALLTVGAGMDPDRTGLENITHMGLLQLVRPRDMARHIDDIAAFSELGDFLHLPLRTYSDGMRVRLAFAVATCIEPEILLLDEAIGAGDAQFAQKAQARAMKLYESARVLVMASHNTHLVHQLCNQALWLDAGKVVQCGPVEVVMAAYAEAQHAPHPQPS